MYFDGQYCTVKITMYITGEVRQLYKSLEWTIERLDENID